MSTVVVAFRHSDDNDDDGNREQEHRRDDEKLKGAGQSHGTPSVEASFEVIMTVRFC